MSKDTVLVELPADLYDSLVNALESAEVGTLKPPDEKDQKAPSEQDEQNEKDKQDKRDERLANMLRQVLEGNPQKHKLQLAIPAAYEDALHEPRMDYIRGYGFPRASVSNSTVTAAAIGTLYYATFGCTVPDFE